ncbi:MAG: peptidoglycan-binding protein LysM [Desulfosporosinus sp. BICA1-9]|nr:MAG: peptidoglycan-binding protein LysM [Desulfosporosinus sp. BICA1-9]
MIRRGDTLWHLAQKYQTTVKELVTLNQVRSPNQIREGQSLWVPNGEAKNKSEDPATSVTESSEQVAAILTKESIPEKVINTPWWVTVLRNIPTVATVYKQGYKTASLSKSPSVLIESEIKTYDIIVNQNTESIDQTQKSTLHDVVDNRTNFMTNSVSKMATENQIHSRGLGRFVTKEEVELLSRVIYGEARGEDFLGQVAVGAVVLNRLKDPRFPKTIPSIVYQSGAFTAVDDRQIHLDPDDQAYKAAEAALSGLDPTNGAIFYYNPRLATDKWIKNRTVIKRIGNHTFSI